MSSAVRLLVYCVLATVPLASASSVAAAAITSDVGHHRRTARSDSDAQFAVVIDAGSSGSRVHAYRWPDDPAGGAVMAGIRSIRLTLKMRPGLSDVADNRTTVRDHIAQLIRNASGRVPPSQQHVTPIYFMATAGMRQLMEAKMNELVLFINSLMRDSTINPFYVSPTSARILSGEEEGVFEWITVNYLLGNFAEESIPTAGILEMGGASTQIAFVPTGNVLADKFPVRVGHAMYSLYVHSYLDYGQVAVVRNIKNRLRRESGGASDIDNPCMMTGDEQDDNGGQKFVGTGDPAACLRLLEEIVYKADPSQCQPKPCAIGSFYQPTLPADMDFYAVGAFLHTLTAIGAVDADGRYIPSVGFDKAFEYCRKPYSEAVASEREEKERKYVTNKCLMSLYIPLLFHTGYGFDNNSEHIYVVKDIAGEEPDWTLGAVMYENAQFDCWMMTNSASGPTTALNLITSVLRHFIPDSTSQHRGGTTGRLRQVVFVFVFAVLGVSNTRMSICISSS